MTQESKYSFGPCQAPYHVEGCTGKGSTKDHFTPKVIARIIGWTRTRVNAADNIQYLSRACHDEKDRTTAARAMQLRSQLMGQYIGLGEHV